MSLFLYLLCFFIFFSSICYDLFCHRFVAICFVTDLLLRVVVLSMINLFVGFRISNSDDKIQFDRVIKSNLVRQYVEIWNLKYSKDFFIIKCVDLESIIFVINLDYAL